MDQDDRIDQFRKMAQANPDDDLAHFALGQALCDADRGAEAIRVLKHVIKLNDTYSRAYVLLGIAQIEEEDTEAAIETFQSGYAAAMSRGDLMPATEIKQRLHAVRLAVGAGRDDGGSARIFWPAAEGRFWRQDCWGDRF